METKRSWIQSMPLTVAYVFDMLDLCFKLAGINLQNLFGFM